MGDASRRCPEPRARDARCVSRFSTAPPGWLGSTLAGPAARRAPLLTRPASSAAPPRRLELVARPPGGQARRLGDPDPEVEEEPGVLDHPRQVEARRARRPTAGGSAAARRPGAAPRPSPPPGPGRCRRPQVGPGHADLGEAELVGAVVGAVLGERLARDRAGPASAAAPPASSSSVLWPLPIADEVAGASEHVHGVEVDVGGDAPGRHRRVAAPASCEPSRPCSSAVTTAKRIERGRPLAGAPRRPGRWRAAGHAGGVVDGAVVDRVAGPASALADPEVVVVGGVDDDLVRRAPGRAPGSTPSTLAGLGRA